MISERLHELIEKVGLSQKDIATNLGLSQQRFNYYVTGRREPDADTLSKIADYFDVTTDYLIGRKGKKKASPSEDGLAKLLQEPLMDEIYRAALQLSPEARRIILAQIEAVSGLESGTKK